MNRLSHQEALNIAGASVEEAVGFVMEDPHRVTYHASAPVFWMNDPNGLIYYQGEYHLFYQHNPYGVEWGSIHWAHMKSKDLIHWEHLPMALAPSEEYDRDGCFSGSAVEHEGRLYLFYTANRFTSAKGLPDDLIQQQCVAVSSDGINFDKIEQNPVIAAPPESIGQTNHFRDPKVWKRGDAWYMVLGTKKHGRGKVVLYHSADLIQWQFLGVLTESDGTLGHMHECPDLFPLGGKDVLLYSPEGVGGESLSGYSIGELDYDKGVFRHGAFRRLDYGFNFYAPQTMTDDRGRRILFGWMPMNGKSLDKSWAGCMTLPRELKYTGGNRLQIQPVDEMKLLRTNHLKVEEYFITDHRRHAFRGISGDCIEMIVVFDLHRTDAKQFGLHVRRSKDGREKTVVSYDAETGSVSIDRTHSGEGDKGVRECAVEADRDRTLKLQLFLDRSTLELFINEGDAVMSGFIFPDPASTGIELFSVGGTAVVQSLDFWEMAR
ncbi:glycoside hydrolase family 32 protein [Cohnella silvisoli]|uniref:Sucrose-6-phosphate hydrolase n=1 Tax=Cohnella silvisoli TaxID=2873699 RepID=A0ABV1KSY8_9BACL|nr:glycoside hydrolase family 32 protein [Cohnella silvisoli]MCD9021391.1 glycoside hydrolase family 32 protein [Cohnella silvisoli]